MNTEQDCDQPDVLERIKAYESRGNKVAMPKQQFARNLDISYQALTLYLLNNGNFPQSWKSMLKCQ